MLSTKERAEKEHNVLRANRVLEVIMSYARLDFSDKTTISDEGDVIDAISAGVNMLGEELKSSNLSLREKEQLLREIHHRVKNNLQIISSLLNLQTENIKDKKFLSLIRESQNRIKSMALVHEMLYATADLSNIKFKNYTHTLCDSIYQSYKRPKMNIVFHIEVPENVSFEIDKMIHLGLIMNEIISNSLKYAFKKNKGCISISLKKEAAKFKLVMKDDGVGMPLGFNKKQHSNLGMQLIYMLSEQLDGTVNRINKEGVGYTITF